jgi:hypothetical protein
MPSVRFLALSLLASIAAMGSTPASAVLRNVYSAGTAANACQAALPAYEGAIRKRPLSVQNEGETPAFVTCALAAAGFVTSADLYFNSIDGQQHIVNCTVVKGYMGFAEYLTKQVIVSAGGAQDQLKVVPADFGLDTINMQEHQISFSCHLPPGVGINDFGVGWQQDVGA